MPVPIQMATYRASRNQHLSLSFATRVNLSLKELKNVKEKLFPVHELLR